jgi:hypothetical protein
MFILTSLAGTVARMYQVVVGIDNFSRCSAQPNISSLFYYRYLCRSKDAGQW